jgi:uncharacterized membrane protein
MSLAPLLNAPPVLQLHVACALAALCLGTVQLVRRKSGTAHRLIGWSWVVLILIVSISSFWLHSLMNGFSPIHLLSLFTIYSVIRGVLARRSGNIAAHRLAMLGSAAGLVGAGLATVIPGRLIHEVLFGG